jgi:putative hydrolase of the HAD superfamily
MAPQGEVTNPFEAVLVDAGGVLLLPDPEAMRRVLAPYGAAPDDATCRRAHYDGMAALDHLGRLDWPSVDAVVARSAGVPGDRVADAVGAVTALYLSEPWVPIDGAPQALLALQGAGYRLAVVSNAEGTVEKQLADHRICSVDTGDVAGVAVVVDSAHIGVEKPDPAIFGYALAALAVEPAHCVYLGDSVHFDVNGARAAGILPLHVDPFELCARDDHGHVRSLPDFAEALIGGAYHPFTSQRPSNDPRQRPATHGLHHGRDA